MEVLFLLNYSLMLPKMGMVLMKEKNHSIWEKLLIGSWWDWFQSLSPRSSHLGGRCSWWLQFMSSCPRYAAHGVAPIGLWTLSNQNEQYTHRGAAIFLWTSCTLCTTTFTTFTWLPLLAMMFPKTKQEGQLVYPQPVQQMIVAKVLNHPDQMVCLLCLFSQHGSWWTNRRPD